MQCLAQLHVRCVRRETRESKAVVTFDVMTLRKSAIRSVRKDKEAAVESAHGNAEAMGKLTLWQRVKNAMSVPGNHLLEHGYVLPSSMPPGPCIWIVIDRWIHRVPAPLHCLAACKLRGTGTIP
jgi:hypothetical protein